MELGRHGFALHGGGSGRRRRRSVRAISQKAIDTSTKTTARNKVASALTSGLTPSRTLENTAIGRVVAEGPVTKLAMTRSSSDKVNAKSQPGRRDPARPLRACGQSRPIERAPTPRQN